MKDTCIVFDSSADCKNQEFDDVFVLPTTIISNKNGKVTTYKDGVDITIEEVEKNENEGHFYSTAAVNPSLALELFTKLSKDYKMVYVFPIPGTISPGGVNSLNLAASEFDNVIIVEQSMVSLMSR
jgi:fatty acid-binding protein DegV